MPAMMPIRQFFVAAIIRHARWLAEISLCHVHILLIFFWLHRFSFSLMLSPRFLDADCHMLLLTPPLLFAASHIDAAAAFAVASFFD